MFTGLVEEVGQCQWLRSTKDATQLSIQAPRLEKRVHTGDSVAVNGCCLTVTAHRGGVVSFDLLEETLARTNLRLLRPGSPVNLERALAADGRIGGHFVQGHVDATVKLLQVTARGPDLGLEFELPDAFARYVAFKGSVAINGVSLTVAALSQTSFSVWIIPHTRAETNLGGMAPGDAVNVEFDILAKYAERILGAGPR